VPSPTTKTTSILDTDRNEKLHGEIEDIAAGLANAWTNNLLLLPQEIATTIVDYIKAMKSEVNLSDYYRRDVIDVLIKLYKHAKKSFKDLTRDDILLFLDSFRKPEEVDPLHKWIGTYNLYRIHLQRFFKWLYSPEVEHTKRSKPSVIDNIPKLKRKEVSIYKPSDLWTAEDDLLFLKFCPSARDRCFHAISRDLSCRPHEILKLKIRDLAFKMIGSSQYAEIVVNGKTGTRPIPLINSIPYLKDYLDHEHPMPRNPKAPLICGVGKGLGRHMRYFRMAHVYRSYKQKIFPTLLESPNVPPEDKKRIVELLKKPWNPYIRRHSALTEKSMILKESVLRQHAGWTPNSDMHLKYLHYFGNESSESLLEAYGLIDHGIQIDQLKPKQCSNCAEPNKPDSKFCGKCRMVLTYDAYEETIENQKLRESEVQELKERYEQDMKLMHEKMNQVIEMVQQNPKLAHVKPEVLVNKKKV
jgi:integrase